ncbi:MAG: sugar phosphate isomerase/epimerase, partial [Thermomicrobiales bacterium]
WGHADPDVDLATIFSWGTVTPEYFWDRMLSSVVEVGLDGIELTFPPGDFRNALRTFGSAEGFASEMRSRNLEVASGYLSNRSADGNILDWENPGHHTELIEVTAEYAQFLAIAGCDTIVVSLMLRKNSESDPPLFADLRLAEAACEGLHRAAAIASQFGVTLALHPEAFTVFRTARDVDLYMTLLDPTYVNLCPDTAQFTVAGSDPVAICQRHRDRVVLTHWKDAVGAAPKDVRIDDTIWDRHIRWFAPVGRGVVDWPAWMRPMRNIHYTG